MFPLSCSSTLYCVYIISLWTADHKAEMQRHTCVLQSCERTTLSESRHNFQFYSCSAWKKTRLDGISETSFFPIDSDFTSQLGRINLVDSITDVNEPGAQVNRGNQAYSRCHKYQSVPTQGSRKVPHCL